MRPVPQLVLAVLLAGLGLTLAGCGAGGVGSEATAAPGSGGSSNSGSTSSPTTPSATRGPLHGRAQAGPSRIAGAHVYVFAASSSVPGAASVSLLDTSLDGVESDALGGYVVTDSDGNFGLTGGYHCAPGQLVYVLAKGGSPNGESINPNLALLSTFGVCPATGDFSEVISFVSINQVSTAVSVYALAGFLTDATHVSSGSSENARNGLRNAFLTVFNLMDIGAGTVYPYTPAGSGAIPIATLNTLANLLVPCSNDVSACGALLSLAPDAAGTLPSDTVVALLHIAQNPAANVGALFALASGGTFQPALTAAPNDWTVGITYFAENMVGPYFPAIDAGGTLWVPGYANNTLTRFDPFGNILSGATGITGGGLSQPFAVAIDTSGNAWVSNFGTVPPGTPSVSEFAANGAPITSNGFSCGLKCSFLAIDGSQNTWVSGAPQVSVLRSSGATLSAFTPNGAASGIAIDSQGRGWMVGSGRNLTRLTVPGTEVQFPEAVTAAAGSEVNPIAIDAADNIWLTSPQNNALGEFSKDGAAISPTAGYTGGGLSGPTGLAVDGSGRIWVANRDGNSLSAFDPAGKALSPSTGYQAAGISNPRGIAIDPGGNVWITSFTGNAVTEFLGVATPTATPLMPSNHGRLP